MAISVISISSDSSEDSVGTHVRRVILFGTISTTIPDTTPVITPPATQTDTPAIPTETPINSTYYTNPPSQTIHQLLLITSHSHLIQNSDTPDTPPSPTHGTPFTEITASTQRSPIIPHSSSEASSDFHSDASSDSSSRHSLSDHSSPDLPSTSAGPSRKRRRSPMTSVSALPLVSGALSPVRLSDDPHERRILIQRFRRRLTSILLTQMLLGIEGRVVVEAADRDETRYCMRGRLEALFQFHRIQPIEGIQESKGPWMVGVESAVIALTERMLRIWKKRDLKKPPHIEA
ncbi:hypothetical protein Tco_0194781 [Tanacetum coccineum]